MEDRIEKGVKTKLKKYGRGLYSDMGRKGGKKSKTGWTPEQAREAANKRWHAYYEKRAADKQAELDT